MRACVLCNPSGHQVRCLCWMPSRIMDGAPWKTIQFKDKKVTDGNGKGGLLTLVARRPARWSAKIKGERFGLPRNKIVRMRKRCILGTFRKEVGGSHGLGMRKGKNDSEFSSTKDQVIT